MKLTCPNFESTLAAVRELSENATRRPAPRVLRCAPVAVRELKPIPAWKQRYFRLLESFAR